MLPRHTSISAVEALGPGWAGPVAPPDPQSDAEGQQAGTKGDDATPQWQHVQRRVLQNRLLSCTESSCRGFGQGDVGTTMSPAPSLPARPPRTGARGIGRRIAMGVLGFG